MKTESLSPFYTTKNSHQLGGGGGGDRKSHCTCNPSEQVLQLAQSRAVRDRHKSNASSAPQKRVSAGSAQPSKHWVLTPMLFQCWASVEDGGPTLKQHWCVLGRARAGSVCSWRCIMQCVHGRADAGRICRLYTTLAHWLAGRGSRWNGWTP